MYIFGALIPWTNFFLDGVGHVCPAPSALSLTTPCFLTVCYQECYGAGTGCLNVNVVLIKVVFHLPFKRYLYWQWSMCGNLGLTISGTAVRHTK